MYDKDKCNPPANINSVSEQIVLGMFIQDGSSMPPPEQKPRIITNLFVQLPIVRFISFSFLVRFRTIVWCVVYVCLCMCVCAFARIQLYYRSVQVLILTTYLIQLALTNQYCCQ